jgi:N-acetylmuramate 1-kinase
MTPATGTVQDQEREALEHWLATTLPARGPFALTLMTGGASPRRFCRVRTAGGESLVVMLVPEHTPDVAKARELGRQWPFLEIRELLEQRGVRVPRLIAQDTAQGRLLVEDLGATLAEHLATAPGERAELYRKAVRDLERAQRALQPLPEDSMIRLRAFDHALLHWELQHFREWGLEARGIGLNAEQSQRFGRAATHLAATIAALPQGFVHRDYQSRNLMVCRAGGATELGWIDFQDALLGPRAYDLVALLCDSYQPFDRVFVDSCLDDYARAAELDAAQRAALGREFDLITVQRKLKDAGRFVFIERSKGDASFLVFVEPTLAIVRQALDRLGDDAILADLAALLAQLVPGGRGAPG